MTPQQKAKKLFDYHYFFMRNDQERRYLSIQCALTTVNEVIDEIKDYKVSLNPTNYENYKHFNSDILNFQDEINSRRLYWWAVKQELEKLLS